jgi:EAL domain-containing protein (putative c-di-GMP-specific phosphodiesterase class I)
MAMYRAKLDGKGRYTVFDARMSGQARDRLELEQDLRRAIERNELELYYQPIVSLADDRIVAMEALVRWQHPQRGFVPPTLFIALAEETGLIVPLGQRVLASACGQMAAWHQRYPHERPVRVCVNLSPRQCHAPTLLADIQRTVQETGLDAASLELEITESVLMEPGPRTSEMLQALKQLGIRLSIDDFGTGYSSLAYLQRFPSDTLKIDRSFVQGIARDSKGAALVRAVIMVAQALELEVIAEGIETPEQLAVLQELKCDLGQGFYIGEPLPASAADAFLSSAARSPGVVNARRAVDHALHV